MTRHGSFAVDSADDRRLTAFVNVAERRLIVLAPGLSVPVARAVAERWQSLGAEAVNVILDVDAQVYRLGYGDAAALDLLEQTAASLGTTLNRHPRVRIGLVIADDATLVYSPTPLLVEANGQRGAEAGPQPQPPAPNAIRLGPPPETLERDLGRGPNGVREQTVGLDKAERAAIADVQHDLERNPPQRFDIARQVQVFNAYFEFVEFELLGTHLDRKTVPIPSELLGVVDGPTRKQLRTSFSIVPPEDALAGKYLHKIKQMITRKYLRHIPDHGTVILRTQKDAFLEEVEQLREDVKAFRHQAAETLQEAMDNNRAALVEAMLPTIEQSPPASWRLAGKAPHAARLRELLEHELASAFGKAEQLLGHMQVRTVFKAVTYESLCDKAFIEKGKQAVPEMQQLHEEFEAALGAEPATPAADAADAH